MKNDLKLYEVSGNIDEDYRKVGLFKKKRMADELVKILGKNFSVNVRTTTDESMSPILDDSKLHYYTVTLRDNFKHDIPLTSLNRKPTVHFIWPNPEDDSIYNEKYYPMGQALDKIEVIFTAMEGFIGYYFYLLAEDSENAVKKAREQLRKFHYNEAKYPKYLEYKKKYDEDHLKGNGPVLSYDLLTRKRVDGFITTAL